MYKRQAFSGLSASTPGLDTTYVVSGTYKEEKLLELVAHVEAATGMTARIIGTKPALRKVTSAVMADAAKDSYYNVCLLYTSIPAQLFVLPRALAHRQLECLRK